MCAFVSVCGEAAAAAGSLVKVISCRGWQEEGFTQVQGVCDLSVSLAE